MPRFRTLPDDLFLTKQTTIVGAVGSPGCGVGIAVHSWGPGEPYAQLRVLSFDADLNLRSDESVSTEPAVHPVTGGAWRDGRPVVYLSWRPPIACEAPEGNGDWQKRASDALLDTWHTKVYRNSPRGFSIEDHFHNMTHPGAGVFLTSGWLTASTTTDGSTFWLAPFDSSIQPRPVTMGSDDADEQTVRMRLVPRVFTQVVALDGQRFAFAGSECTKGTYYDHKLGVYDLATNKLVVVKKPPWRAEHAVLAHDGHDRLLLWCKKVVYRYHADLEQPEAVTANEAPFLKSWTLLGGNTLGQTLWHNERTMAICLADAADLAGDDLTGALHALRASCPRMPRRRPPEPVEAPRPRLSFDFTTLDEIHAKRSSGEYGPTAVDVAVALRLLATDLEVESVPRRSALRVVLWRRGTGDPLTAAIVPYIVALIEAGCDTGGELARALEDVGCAAPTDDASSMALQAAIAGHADVILGWRPARNRTVARLGAAIPALRSRWLAILAAAPALTTEEYLGLATLPETPAWAIDRARADATNPGAAILLTPRGGLDPALAHTIEEALAPAALAQLGDLLSAFGLDVPRAFDGPLLDGHVVFASKALVLVRTGDRNLTLRIPDTGAVRGEAVQVGISVHGEPRVLERRDPDGAVRRFTVEP